MKFILLFAIPAVAFILGNMIGYANRVADRKAVSQIVREEVKTTYLNADYKEVFEACTRELYKQQSQ